MSGHRQALDNLGIPNLPDPGNAGAINPNGFGTPANVDIVTAGAETRTVPDPVKSGMTLKIGMKTDGGDCVITFATAYDEAGTTTFTLSDPGQCGIFESFAVSTTAFVWRRVGGESGTAVTNGSNLIFNGTVVATGTTAFGSVANAADRVVIKGFYMNPAVIAVAVPTIANDAAENGDVVAVDVDAGFTFACAVGDAVIAIPMAALPTDCLLCGAYVTAANTITVTFMSKEGGGGVTGANVNFNFLVIDLT